MKRFVFRLLMVSLLAGMAPSLKVSAEDSRAVRSRTFQFNYGGEVTDLKPGADVRVWLPVPMTSESQEVTQLESTLPATAHESRESRYGNTILSFSVEAPADGVIAFQVPYRVTRREMRANSNRDGSALTAAEKRLYLQPNRMVPISGKPLDLLPESPLPRQAMEGGRVIYDLVDEHVRYDKSNPGYGNGDVLWVCNSRFGNCTDFHSLFISLARAHGIPARFEIGFPLPPKRGAGRIGGYHCWAFFHDKQQGWVPVDVSEADKHPELKDYYFGSLTEDRVAFSMGRDLILSPPQKGPPLNFFIYPYVEVDGQPISKDQLELKFTYRDE